MKAIMILGREVRRVPFDYEPPQDPRGGHRPVFDQHYEKAVRDYEDRRARWDAGERPEYYQGRDDGTDWSFAEYEGEPPDPGFYYPGSCWPEDAEMAIRMYETVTEGTPISRPYPDTPAGRRAMANELATRDTGITPRSWPSPRRSPRTTTAPTRTPRTGLRARSWR